MANVDCEFEMGGADGPVCAWSPGVCKSWCRTNAVKWVPTAIGIFDDVNNGSFAGFGVHIDMLTLPFLRSVLSCCMMDEHSADMHAETMESLGMDGIFGSGIVLGKQRDDIQRGVTCVMSVSGLVKPIQKDDDRVSEPSERTVSIWDNWEYVSDGPKTIWAGGSELWEIRTLKIVKRADTYTLYRTQRVVDEPSLGSGVDQNRDQAIEAVSKTMGDDMSNMRMSHSKLFYTFNCSTHPWSYQKRRAFATLLDVLTKYMKGSVTKKAISSHVAKYTFSPMGPQTSSRGGNIHVTLKRPPPNGTPEITWGSSIRTAINIDVDPRKEFDPIGIDVTTAW